MSEIEERGLIYRRQSSDPRNTELGIERQLKVCQETAERRGITVTQVITDNDTSASKHGRPGYGQLIELMKSGEVDVVLFLRIDRLLRLNDELEELIKLVEQYPVRVITSEGEVDLSTPQGRLIARILVSVARNEIETKSARTKLANAQRAAAGLPHRSWRAFGYEPDGMTIRESEAAVLREMARMVIAGHSYREIALWANESGSRTVRGNLWYPRTTRQILTFKRYAGIREYEGVDYPAQWPPIFDSETWERLQLSMRLKTENHANYQRKPRKYLLTGLLYCGNCGNPMHGTMKRDRPGKANRRTYICRYPGDRKNHGCGKVYRGAPALEHFVTECVLLRLDSPQLAERISQTGSDDKLRHLLEQREIVQLRLNGVLDDYGTGVLNRAQMIRSKGAAEKELTRLNSELLRLAPSAPNVTLPEGMSFREAWDQSGSDNWRRSVMSLIVERIVVNQTLLKPWYQAGEQRYRFAPEAVEVLWRV